ncbi:MAG: hypothetical protein M3Q29_04950 [Chloroflexota bacterium]|nr:hypothetical protein [Chloroflexota bacterium]
MTSPNIARILEDEAIALDSAALSVRSALAGWAEARRRWEAADSHIEDWDELVGRWVDAYDQAVRRQLQGHERDRELYPVQVRLKAKSQPTWLDWGK